MDVVINRCFGGFGLSEDAQRRLVGRCEHIRLAEPRDYYGDDEWEARFAEERASRESSFYVIVDDGKIVVDSHRDRAARACPRLVEVVRDLGEKANGSFADLAIVSIPDGAQWEISEYDGMEHAAAQHRTWP